MAEKTYKDLKKFILKEGFESMGIMTSWAWRDDPKRLAFMMARYKFVSKMFEGFKLVAEVGCGDGFGSRIVADNVKKLDCYDFDKELLASAISTQKKSKKKISFYFQNFLKHKVKKKYDGIYSLDVLEHINKKNENLFIKNLLKILNKNGIVIIGTPSLESQKYASRFSKLGHVNCKSQKELKIFLKRYFSHVFSFSMNDEIVHTGYSKMSHYNFMLCCK